MPCRLAASFTLAQQAALAVIILEVQRHGECTLPIAKIAALAGVCPTTVKGTLRLARVDLLEVEPRRIGERLNLPSRITIKSAELRAFLGLNGRDRGAKRRRGGGGAQKRLGPLFPFRRRERAPF